MIDAGSLFAEYLEAGDGVQFDTWIKGHPEHEEDLRRIHADWRLLGAARKKGVSFFKSGEHERPQPAPGLEAGKVIGDFRLVELIGQGGMGQVWEAEQVSLRRRVAVKFVRPERVTAKQLDYFAREARAGGRLAHPGIVAVHGYGEDDGISWIAMELVEGCWTLRDFLDDLAREDEVPDGYDKQVARFIAQLAQALQAAHEAGVIHRDLKPQNILVSPGEKPKVTDFGLARITDETGLSETGDFAGTYFYMSPEQVAAKRTGIDHRTDIFSLGVVMYEMLALRRPFQGDTTHQVAQQIMWRDAPDMRVMRSKIPQDLSVICAKALEKNPERRFFTMAEMAEDIERHLSNEPIHAQLPTIVDRAIKWTKRNPTKSVAGVLVATAFVVISGLALRIAKQKGDLESTNTALGAKTDELKQANTVLGVRTDELAEANLEWERIAESLVLANEALETKTEEAQKNATAAEEARVRAEDALVLEAGLGWTDAGMPAVEGSFERIGERVLTGGATKEDLRRLAMACVRPNFVAEAAQPVGELSAKLQIEALPTKGIPPELAFRVRGRIYHDDQALGPYVGGMLVGNCGGGSLWESIEWQSDQVRRFELSTLIEIQVGSAPGKQGHIIGGLHGDDFEHIGEPIIRTGSLVVTSIEGPLPSSATHPPLEAGAVTMVLEPVVASADATSEEEETSLHTFTLQSPPVWLPCSIRVIRDGNAIPAVLTIQNLFYPERGQPVYEASPASFSLPTSISFGPDRAVHPGIDRPTRTLPGDLQLTITSDNSLSGAAIEVVFSDEALHSLNSAHLLRQGRRSGGPKDLLLYGRMTPLRKQLY